MRKWNTEECNWDVREYVGSCGICTKPATCHIELNRFLKIQHKDRLLCKECLSKFIKGEINL